MRQGGFKQPPFLFIQVMVNLSKRFKERSFENSES